MVMPDNGKRKISLSLLRKLQQTALAEQMLPEVA
jgi:hypothetical protein